jgi:hypothetical protein
MLELMPASARRDHPSNRRFLANHIVHRADRL